MDAELSKEFQIDITEAGIVINNILFQLPVSIGFLQQMFGKARRNKSKYSTIYTWDQLGLFVHAKDKIVDTLSISLRREKNYQFLPAADFGGSLNINGLSYQNISIKRKKEKDKIVTVQVGKYDLHLLLDNDNDILGIQIDGYEPEPLKDPDKYKLQPIAGEKMVLTDFNFKLCVVQILMYEKQLIQPVFNLREFAERYKEREIDTEKEGYDIIPEARAWFEQLEIDRKFAHEIIDIDQCGGSDIYFALYPFFSGETDEFNIQSFEDVKQFPNLKKVELFYEGNETIRKANEAVLLEHGIVIE